jgi:hypothetical protein
VVEGFWVGIQMGNGRCLGNLVGGPGCGGLMFGVLSGPVDDSEGIVFR